MTSVLPRMITALLDPNAYPEATQKVELRQTQMSFILLTDSYAYKIKKPVNLGYLDYTTLEKRQLLCQKEVELNRRLCPGAYLGVVTINLGNGAYSIGGQGKAIEYAVKMRRLPQEAMMDILLASNRVSPEMVGTVAQTVAEFHQKAETNTSISAFGSLEVVIQNTGENFAQTEKNISKTISPEKYQRIKDYTNRFIDGNPELFKKRVNEGKIKDCHGDLHAAHICFTDGICIYDCIEFNDRFRYGDVASEIAFLAMDLDHYGRADLSRAFVKAYIEASQDKELKELLNFYKCYRAYVRGKVEGFKLDDPYIPNKKQIADTASSYFDLAYSYTKAKPTLFITVGLMGTGKTSLAQALAKRLGLVVISSDVVRKKLAGISPTEHHFEEYRGGIYSEKSTSRTYEALLAGAREVLTDGDSVVLDASFIKAGERRAANALADELDADFFVLECVLPPEAVKERLQKRLGEVSASDGRWEIFETQKGQFEPVLEIPSQNHAIIKALLPAEELVKKLVASFG